MKVLKNITIPTGNIIIAETEIGKLEFLSVGDYGKEKNIKADFMGLTKDISYVPHSELLPLSKKWFMTISPQYGCSMNCKFCDAPKAGSGRNVSFNDLINQVNILLDLHPEIKHAERINLHYARLGEPLFNYDVIKSAYYFAGMFKAKGWGFHPVISTIVPNTVATEECVLYITEWLKLKHYLGGDAGLQLSINTTDARVRMKTMPNSYHPYCIARIVNDALNEVNFSGRKIALNFAVTDAKIDAEEIKRCFDPKYYMCKLSPMYVTDACRKNGLLVDDDTINFSPCKKAEEDLKAQGFDVIVFTPSKEEDESMITCGNAILKNKER